MSLKLIACALFGHKYKFEENQVVQVNLGLSPKIVHVITERSAEQIDGFEPDGSFTGASCRYKQCSRCGLIADDPVPVVYYEREEE